MIKKLILFIILSAFPLFLNADNLLIITKLEYLDALKVYTNWKTDIGDMIAVKTIEEIKTLSGCDLPEKIRTFIINTNNITKFHYVLLIGSYDDIPARMVQPAYNTPSHYSGVLNVRFCSDQYYADLHGDWDDNNNGIYGEYPDDNITFNTDVFVGRVPFNSPHLIEDYLRRVIMFQQDNRNYKQNVILAGAVLYFQNEDGLGYPFIDGAEVLEYLKKNIIEKEEALKTFAFYEKEGWKKSSFPCNEALDEGNLFYLWQKGAGYVNIEAHGSPWAVYRKTWNADDGNNIPESIEMTSSCFIDTFSPDYLSNLRPSVIFVNSCLTADPDYDNLCLALLKQGAINYIGGTTVIYGVSDWKNEQSGGSSSFNYFFTQALIKEKISIGKAFYKSKMIYTDFFNFYDVYLNEAPVVNQITLLSFNLFGDPSISFDVKKPGSDIVSPYITDFLPKKNEKLDYGKIKVNFKIADTFSGINNSSIKLFINNKAITDFTITDIDDYSIQVEYIVNNSLQNGSHYYKIIASDNSGNTCTNIIYFNINKDDSDLKISKFVCYPNPCYDRVLTFYFETEEESMAWLKIYNMAGELVKEMNSIECYNWGNTVNWDNINLSSGIYVTVLLVEKNKKSRKAFLKVAIIR